MTSHTQSITAKASS